MVVLVNPNTNRQTTELMVTIADAAAPGLGATGRTVGQGVPMITTAEELALAAEAVGALAGELGNVAGVIVAAFGDPGLDLLRSRLRCPVTGIGEASFLEAAAGGRRFGVATSTPGLVAAIAARVEAAGLAEQFSGTVLTPGDPIALTQDPERLFLALAEAAAGCAQQGAEAIIIGGGPLAAAAARLRAETGLSIVEPVPAAARRMARLLAAHAAGD